jgi:hypothetical protein
MFVSLKNTNLGLGEPVVLRYSLAVLGSTHHIAPHVAFMSNFCPLYCNDPLTPQELPSSVVGISRDGRGSKVCRVVPHITYTGNVVNAQFVLDIAGPQVPVAAPRLNNVAFEDGIVAIVWINKGVHVAFWCDDGSTSEAVCGSTQPDGAWEVLATRVVHGTATVLASCTMPGDFTRHWVIRFDRGHAQELSTVRLARGMGVPDGHKWTITSKSTVVVYSTTGCIAWDAGTGARITDYHVSTHLYALSPLHRASRDYFVVLAGTTAVAGTHFVLVDLSELGAHSHPLHACVRRLEVATAENACTDGKRLCQCIKVDESHYRATVTPIDGVDNAYSRVYDIRPERAALRHTPILLGNSVTALDTPPTRVCRGLPRVADHHHRDRLGLFYVDSPSVHLIMPEPAPPASTGREEEEDEEVVQMDT